MERREVAQGRSRVGGAIGETRQFEASTQVLGSALSKVAYGNSAMVEAKGFVQVRGDAKEKCKGGTDDDGALGCTRAKAQALGDTTKLLGGASTLGGVGNRASGGDLVLSNVVEEDGEVGEHMGGAWGAGSGDVGVAICNAIQVGDARRALDLGEEGDDLGGSDRIGAVRQTRGDSGLGDANQTQRG
ncbi:unnamed protein product, partial [Ilex paraguariensis]